MDIRSTTSHKLAKIYYESSIIYDLIGKARLAFEGVIVDGVRLALTQARQNAITGPEIVNVLIAADAVCRKTRSLSTHDLELLLGVSFQNKAQVEELNYFDLVSTLYFARARKSFSTARNSVITEIERRISALGAKLHTRTEATMLFFDFLSCPYIDETRRLTLFSSVTTCYGSLATPLTLQTQYERVKSSLGFTAWNGSEYFQAMLERRELQPAYDS